MRRTLTVYTYYIYGVVRRTLYKDRYNTIKPTEVCNITYELPTTFTGSIYDNEIPDYIFFRFGREVDRDKN